MRETRATRGEWRCRSEREGVQLAGYGKRREKQCQECRVEGVREGVGKRGTKRKMKRAMTVSGTVMIIRLIGIDGY